LFTPEFVAQFLEWLLLDVHGAELGELEWNIRDTDLKHIWQKLV
jgi:hypothetical protein